MTELTQRIAAVKGVPLCAITVSQIHDLLKAADGDYRGTVRLEYGGYTHDASESAAFVRRAEAGACGSGPTEGYISELHRITIGVNTSSQAVVEAIHKTGDLLAQFRKSRHLDFVKKNPDHIVLIGLVGDVKHVMTHAGYVNWRFEYPTLCADNLASIEARVVDGASGIVVTNIYTDELAQAVRNRSGLIVHLMAGGEATGNGATKVTFRDTDVKIFNAQDSKRTAKNVERINDLAIENLRSSPKHT
ncbi:MAG: hypothetical protein JWR21_4351 [Herminiimonas sp.]|nr:hypothetical protein [Herminiimonas sp.]